MTPGARLQAALELLSQIQEGGPADQIAAAYFRGRRYIGAKDRSAVLEAVYGVLRHRAALDWWVERSLGRPDPSPRPQLLSWLALGGRWSPEAIAKAFDGARYAPAPLTEEERRLVRRLSEATERDGPLAHRDMPRWVRDNYPAWLDPHLEAAFGADLDAEMAALAGPASLDLRVNTLKSDRETARDRLAAQGVESRPTPWSPVGLRAEGHPSLPTLEAFREGWVEVQDEGSQVVSRLVDARPGLWVADYCAGAGGKTLALAADMENRGRLVACDSSASRLARAAQRLRRAGVHNAERRPLVGDNDRWVKRNSGRFDRVLVDAPCSGTGTWRRNPDARWRLTPRDITELTALQQRILRSAARLVRPGGRLVYVTCSVLVEENEAQVTAFLAEHAAFAIVPVEEVWRSAIGGDAPVKGPYLRLTPGLHGTDGFFAAVLARREDVPSS